MRRRQPVLLLSVLLALSLVAAACGGGDDDNDNSQGTTQTTAAEKVDKGGTLVLGAEQEPDCADWIGSCAGAAWGAWTMGAHTMPRPFDFVDAKYVITPLMASAPKLEEGPPQKVTYEINEKAVWSDGTPITSEDFKFTWEQITTGSDIYDTTGYKDIEKLETPDPKTAVATFSKPYAAWRDLFGGYFGVFPSHILKGKDRNAEMKDGYTWSGGPWMIPAGGWVKGQEVKLVPNPKYWGSKPNLDAVVFKFIPDTAAEIQAYKTGQVAAIYPQASLDLPQLKTAPDTEFKVDVGLSYEALWLNTSKPPLDSKAVRQSIAYSIDRDAIVTQLFGPVQPGIKPIQSFATPANKTWYQTSFSKYKLDLAKVDELMKGDGWTKGSDEIWAKAGKKATFEVNSTAGNKRRELTEQILQSQLKAAGFNLTVNNTKAGTLFGQWLPQGVFHSAIFAQTPSSDDPGQCVNFCSENVPSAANKNTGLNYYRIKSPAIDEPWRKVDTELDESARKGLVKEGVDVLAEEVPAIPIDPFPDVIIYNSAKIGGPVRHNFSHGAFWNMHLWYCKGGTC